MNEVMEHDPCCSSHGITMSCERYRFTHFVEVRPCCSVDVARLRGLGIDPSGDWRLRTEVVVRAAEATS